jgi:hypothetical protein
MTLPPVNYLAVLVSGIVIFILGGLWYSPVLFAKPWIAAMGKTEEELRASAKGAPMPLFYFLAFLCGLTISMVMAIVLNHWQPFTLNRGFHVGLLMWLGFAAPTSFATAIFSMTTKKLWLINSFYNLVSFIIAGVILSIWR